MAQVSVRLTTANGLAHNAVTGVEQDEAGFIWIATHDGLVRFDGRTTKIFRNRQGDSQSLIENKISRLERTTKGKFLLFTESGSFQLFDPVKEKFSTLLEKDFLSRKKISLTSGQLTADGDHLWGIQSNSWLIDYDVSKKTLKVYEISKMVEDSYLTDFVLTNQGYIYATCSKGLFQFNTKTGQYRIVPLPFKTPTRIEEAGFWPINGHKVVEGPGGQIAIFGRNVIGLYDPDLDRMRTVPIPDVVQTSTAQNRRLSTVVSYAMKTLSDKRLYLGYMDKIYYLDDRGLFTKLNYLTPNPDKVAPWLIDRSGVLWTSAASAGLSRLNLDAPQFIFAPRKRSFSEDLLVHDLKVSLPDNFEVWDNDHWPRYILDDAKVGYLIDPSRVYQHDTTRKTLTELTDFWQIQNGTYCDLSIKPGKRGGLWVYHNSLGLIGGKKQFRIYPNSVLPYNGVIGTKPGGYTAGDIQPIGTSIWIGSQTGLGLFRYDTIRKQLDKPLVNDPKSSNSLSNNIINCLAVDAADSTVLWIGTAGGGVCRFATQTLTFRRFSNDEGFPSNIIQSIETDGKGFVWCATNQGLVRINPTTFHWRHFTTDDGLAENAFLLTSSAHLPDGRLLFGVNSGRITFSPASIKDTGYEPPLALTSLAINNRQVDAYQLDLKDKKSLLSSPLNTLPELILDYNQNFLTITFAGLDYANSQKLRYRYKLTGVDADWVSTGYQNTANYTQLAPGKYVFQVNSTKADGQWSRQIKKLRIIITPPIWASPFAYLFYTLAFGGLVFGFVRFRVKQIQQQQEIILKNKEAEQLRVVDEVKTQFFSNITHEFRTPLTLILSPTEKLLKIHAQDIITQQALTSIRNNATQLMRLINQLLDLSKLEGKSMKIALGRGDVVALVARVVENFTPLGYNRGITLSLHYSENVSKQFNGAWLFDADKWEKVLSNLLSNSLKFTPSQGVVSVTIEELTQSQIIIHLADTGVGIPEEYIPHIFDRFYQVDTSNTRAFEGSGIGLALVKELVDLMGGSIEVKSSVKIPTGTTFILTLPLMPASNQTDAHATQLPEIDTKSISQQIVPLETEVLANGLKLAADTPMVLIVEDNEELRIFIMRELMDRYRVLTASNGQEAWTICQRDLPDLVIADVMMPVMDGYQLTHLLKSTLATNHIPVVLLTARAAYESRMEGLEQGADDYLTKPFHIDELLLRLNNMLILQANLRDHQYRCLSEPASVAKQPMVDMFVTQLHEVIEARLDDSNFNIDELAEAVSMSRRTLHRKLVMTTNLSAGDFIRHYRMQRARQLLQEGRLISETAYLVGFESPAYFSTVFKQTYQQTPSEFQSLKRN